MTAEERDREMAVALQVALLSNNTLPLQLHSIGCGNLNALLSHRGRWLWRLKARAKQEQQSTEAEVEEASFMRPVLRSSRC